MLQDKKFTPEKNIYNKKINNEFIQELWIIEHMIFLLDMNKKTLIVWTSRYSFFLSSILVVKIVFMKWITAKFGIQLSYAHGDENWRFLFTKAN
jgi:hypothetical protein